MLYSEIFYMCYSFIYFFTLIFYFLTKWIFFRKPIEKRIFIKYKFKMETIFFVMESINI